MPVGIGLGLTAGAGVYASKKAGDAADKASEASLTGANMGADAQQQALDYLKQSNALPMEMRDSALTGLQQLLQSFTGTRGFQRPDAGGNVDITSEQIQNWLRQNPTATDDQIFQAMIAQGISPEQVAQATGKNIGDVNTRYNAAGRSFQLENAGFRAPKGQAELIEEGRNSPLYAAIQGTKQGAVDEMARYASATGHLRSGNAKAAFAREGQRIDQQALLAGYSDALNNDRYGVDRGDVESSFLSGQQNYDRAFPLSILSMLAGTSGNENSIASLMSGVGTTRGQGVVAAGQAQQQGSQNQLNNLLALLGIGVQGYGAYKGV